MHKLAARETALTGSDGVDTLYMFKFKKLEVCH